MKNLIYLGLLLSSTLTVAQDDFAKEDVKSTPLTSSMYMLEGVGANMTALIDDDSGLISVGSGMLSVK